MSRDEDYVVGEYSAPYYAGKLSLSVCVALKPDADLRSKCLLVLEEQSLRAKEVSIISLDRSKSLIGHTKSTCLSRDLRQGSALPSDLHLPVDQVEAHVRS